MQLIFHSQPTNLHSGSLQLPTVVQPECSFVKSIKADTTICIKSDGSLVLVTPVSNLRQGEPTQQIFGSNGASSAAQPYNVHVRDLDKRLKIPFDKYSISHAWSYRNGILFFLKARTPEPSPVKNKDGLYPTNLYFYYVYDDL